MLSTGRVHGRRAGFVWLFVVSKLLFYTNGTYLSDREKFSCTLQTPPLKHCQSSGGTPARESSTHLHFNGLVVETNYIYIYRYRCMVLS